MVSTHKVSMLAVSLMICCALSAAAIGQAVYGNIFGTVTDQSGAAVPGATVTITNLGTNVSVTTKTNSTGNYNQTRLVPGTYRVKVEAPGFKSAVIDTVVVNVDRASDASLQLITGAVTEEITITAAAPLLKTDRAASR